MRRPTPLMQQRLYRSRKWAKLSAQARVIYGDYCSVDPRHPGPFHVHHRISIVEDWGLRFWLTNLEVLCVQCHKARHPGREATRGKRRKQSNSV